MTTRRAPTALALLPLLSACGVLGPSEDHATLEGSADTPEIPQSLSSIGWNWQPPEGVGVRHVSPTQHGVSVAVSDGVISLSGDTGDELWHYRRPDETITSAATTPDGTKVLVTYAPDEEEDTDPSESPTPSEAVFLDSATGEILGEYTTDLAPRTTRSSSPDSYHRDGHDLGIITDEARIIQERDSRSYGDLVALSLEDGQELWRLAPEPEHAGEVTEPFLSYGLALQDTLVLSLVFTSTEEQAPPSTENPRSPIPYSETRVSS